MSKVAPFMELLIDKQQAKLPGPGAYFDNDCESEKSDTKNRGKIRRNKSTANIERVPETFPGPGDYMVDNKKDKI